jgi:hypothetical protein
MRVLRTTVQLPGQQGSEPRSGSSGMHTTD